MSPDPKNARAVPMSPLDRRDRERCCDQAVKYVGGCVCSSIHRCAIHGERHNGTHD